MPRRKAYPRIGVLALPITERSNSAQFYWHPKGYRPERTLQHYRTILAMPEILGKELKEDAQYLDTCRKKRNIAEYDQIGVISETEAEELLKFAKVLRQQVLDWLKAKHPDLM